MKGNDVGDEGGKMIFESLRDNTALTTLFLDSRFLHTMKENISEYS